MAWLLLWGSAPRAQAEGLDEEVGRRRAAHRGAEDSARCEAIGEDVAGVVPPRIQAQRPQAHDVHLLAAAPLYAPCTSISMWMDLFIRQQLRVFTIACLLLQRFTVSCTMFRP